MAFFENLKARFRNAGVSSRFAMMTERGNGFFEWNGKLYESDIVRACIRPQTRAIGKLLAKHVRKNLDGTIQTNPEPYMRMLLEEPNPLMCGQVMQEKLANQLALNHNAFALIVRDAFGIPIELYPIPAVGVDALYKNNELQLKFYYQNGKSSTFPYCEIIHLRTDFCNNDVFGESPAKALSSLMNVVATIDQGIIRAIKNSGVIRWMLKFTTPMRDEDLKTKVKEFVDNYLDIESDTFGAAGVDGKADAIRIEPKDYVPNAAQTDRTIQRIYSFFNTNEKIVKSTASENEWNTYFELVIEPTALQWSNEYTRKLFTRRERGCGNRIYFDANNLQCATLQTKLQLREMVDRGAMTANEWRATMNLSPVDGGDVPIRRLDTRPTTEGGENG